VSRVRQPSPSRLAVFVDDADAAHERYRTAGAEIVGELKTQPWGLRGFTVRDPDEKLIDVAQQVDSPGGHSDHRARAEASRALVED
jgi:catechol 2,3-dioxygenase-like lactoylglutathione lyase family enzyme